MTEHDLEIIWDAFEQEFGNRRECDQVGRRLIFCKTFGASGKIHIYKFRDKIYIDNGRIQNEIRSLDVIPKIIQKIRKQNNEIYFY